MTPIKGAKVAQFTLNGKARTVALSLKMLKNHKYSFKECFIDVVSLSCSLSNVLKKDVSTAHFTILANSDPRVIKGTVSQFDFYVEAANLMARPAAATSDSHSDRKRVNFLKDKAQAAQPVEQEASSGSEEESYKFKDVVRALH